MADSCHVHLKSCQSSMCWWEISLVLYKLRRGRCPYIGHRKHESEGFTDSSPWAMVGLERKKKGESCSVRERDCNGIWGLQREMDSNWTSGFSSLGNCWWHYRVLRLPVAQFATRPLSTWGDTFTVDQLIELSFFVCLWGVKLLLHIWPRSGKFKTN